MRTALLDPRQCRVSHQALSLAGLLLGDGHQVVPVDQVVGGLLAVVAVAAAVQEDMVRPVLLGVQQIVALLAEP